MTKNSKYSGAEKRSVRLHLWYGLAIANEGNTTSQASYTLYRIDI